MSVTNKQNINSGSFFFFIIGPLIVIIDQLIKHKIRQNGGFYVCNKGISLGLPISAILFWFLFGFFLLFVFFFLKKLIRDGLLEPLFILAIGLILGGALSNGGDRFFFGCVFDYIIPFWNFLPIFNLADFALFMGSCLFVYLLYKKNTRSRA